MRKFILSTVAILASAALFAQAQNASGVRQAEIVPGRTPVSPAIENYFTPVTSESASPDEEGFIRRWLLLEPIAKPNRTNTVFTDSYIREAFSQQYFKGQLTEIPKDGAKVKIEKTTLKWHALDSKLFNVKLFRFASGLKTDVYGVIFWGCTIVDCPEAIENVRLATGSNSASMWWVNSEEAVIMSGDRRMVQDDCMSKRLTLKKGRNYIWFAIINGPGMSDMCARFVDESGSPVTNFTVKIK